MLSLKLSARTQQYLAVGMPLAALAISLLVVFPTWTRYKSATRRADTLAMELGELKAAAMPPRHEQLAAADDTEAEPSQFLGDLATLAAATGCEFSGMDLATSSTADAKTETVLKPVLTKVQIKGTYRQIRAFIYQTRRAPRLYTITELSLRGEPGRDVGGDGIRRLLAMLTIERYVTPPERVTAAPAQPAA